ncbi:TPA: MerR family transcriptional regulator [Burkholderia cenocepacia]|uniref:MerR family transcriptional regulator n=1 Tax=Burkholderia cepacia complex TaxID=87882 RepID=UPI000981CCD8|nr:MULTISPECIES: MerR family transcriptional regulator [Burkholderia cepacia complex]AQQ26351.1 MerR family transcriptional regulator [Burkholderia cenocepacia]AQT50253.1 MerR family transcriptional regulator [Burkholderia cenocepacia]MBJ9729344.1 MerR family transcriptional regulator [Burkholderia cenocepacia]MBR8093489.1 MerR family transcriptional regulator [Burkholderia cenocepacia]MBR8195614.1 MerR family transcriptional regulator [Burkholderia cenocepacia]
MSKTVSQPFAAGPLTIGQVAELTGVSTHTLRYYEQAGLLRAISRTAAGHRLYAPADLDWLAFVMRLKATGMPIAQMQAFAVLREQGESTFGARRDLLVAHRDAVRAHIAELQASLDAIGDKIAYYEARERETERRAKPSHSLSEQDGHDGTTR